MQLRCPLRCCLQLLCCRILHTILSPVPAFPGIPTLRPRPPRLPFHARCARTSVLRLLPNKREGHNPRPSLVPPLHTPASPAPGSPASGPRGRCVRRRAWHRPPPRRCSQPRRPQWRLQFAMRIEDIKECSDVLSKATLSCWAGRVGCGVRHAWLRGMVCLPLWTRPENRSPPPSPAPSQQPHAIRCPCVSHLLSLELPGTNSPP